MRDSKNERKAKELKAGGLIGARGLRVGGSGGRRRRKELGWFCGAVVRPRVPGRSGWWRTDRGMEKIASAELSDCQAPTSPGSTTTRKADGHVGLSEQRIASGRAGPQS